MRGVLLHMGRGRRGGRGGGSSCRNGCSCVIVNWYIYQEIDMHVPFHIRPFDTMPHSWTCICSRQWQRTESLRREGWGSRARQRRRGGTFHFFFHLFFGGAWIFYWGRFETNIYLFISSAIVNYRVIKISVIRE